MGFFSKRKAVVGLDIGSSVIKAVELRPKKGGTFELVSLAAEELAPEAIVDGTILDSELVTETIAKLFKEHKIKNADVATSVSGNAVIIKKIQLPLMNEDELAESIQWEAEQYIPFDIEDVNIDYQILGDPHGSGAENMDVLLVAAKKDKINDYTSVIQRAGKHPVVVDVDAFAVQNAFEANYDISGSEVVALINAGASIMNINILKNGNTIFWRDISVGGNKYTEELQKELHLSQEQAEALKKGLPVEGASSAQAQPILDQVSQEVGQEIQKTFDFFIATSNTDRIDRIALAGGCAKVANLDQILQDRFGTRIELINPFERIEVNSKLFDPEFVASLGASAVVAVGLALRGVGE